MGKDQKRVHRRIDDPLEIELVSSAPGVTTIIRTTSLDISAGGFKAYLNHHYRPSTRMYLNLKMPEGGREINAEVEVVAAEKKTVFLDGGKEVLFETRFKFLQIDVDTQKNIIEYVYEFRRKTR